MKNNMITTTAFCITLLTVSFSNAEDKAVTVAKKDTPAPAKTTVAPKKESSPQAQTLSATDIILDKQINMGFVESFTVMGEGNSGVDERHNIEEKRNFATQEIQEESKQFEKAKADYVAKSTTMTDTAREKEEKKLIKMERELKNLVAEKEEELKLDMQLATETLARELEVAVAQLAKEENLDVVFDKMTGRAIYVSEKLDYTAKAIKEVNKNYEIKLAQNKQNKTAAPATKIADNKAITAPKTTKVGA